MALFLLWKAFLWLNFQIVWIFSLLFQLKFFEIHDFDWNLHVLFNFFLDLASLELDLSDIFFVLLFLCLKLLCSLISSILKNWEVCLSLRLHELVSVVGLGLVQWMIELMLVQWQIAFIENVLIILLFELILDFKFGNQLFFCSDLLIYLLKFLKGILIGEIMFSVNLYIIGMGLERLWVRVFYFLGSLNFRGNRVSLLRVIIGLDYLLGLYVLLHEFINLFIVFW